MKRGISREKGAQKLRKFLIQEQVWAPFLINLHLHGRVGVTDAYSLMNYLYRNGFRLRSALFIAFYWADTPENKKDPFFWNKISWKWRRYLGINE